MEGSTIGAQTLGEQMAVSIDYYNHNNDYGMSWMLQMTPHPHRDYWEKKIESQISNSESELKIIKP